MKEENETFLERVPYAMFRYGLGLYLLSGMVSPVGACRLFSAETIFLVLGFAFRRMRHTVSSRVSTGVVSPVVDVLPSAEAGGFLLS